MFEMFRKKKGLDVYACVQGTSIALNHVDDPVFSQGLVGRGIAIVPEGNVVCSPIKGVLSVVFPTGHAFGITSDEGIEILIHIGVDTVNLKGKGFDLLVEQGQRVELGTPLVNVDFQLLKDTNYHTETMLLVTSTEDVCDFKPLVQEGTKVNNESIVFHCDKR